MSMVLSDGRARRASFVAGFFASLAAVLLIGEAFARLSLPKDIRRHFGEDPTQERIYKPDPQLGADFRSYEDFRAFNSSQLRKLGALESNKPTWLLFGNSFVQGPGHLADTAERALPDMRIFALRRLVDLPLRAAEARMLLTHGLRPQRIFFVLLPHDQLHIGNRPLSFIEVNAQGAKTARPRWPDPPLDRLVQGSRLATIAWLRSGRSAGDPSFKPRHVNEIPSPRIQSDLFRIFNHLGETSRRFGVPVTVVTLPNREQVFGRAAFGFQDTVETLTRRAGVDHHDAHRPFVEATDKRSLFVPDWHFSERGNSILLKELIDHHKAQSAKIPKAS